MIYVVTKNQELFPSDLYKIISVTESLRYINNWDIVQLDTETQGIDARITPILCLQLGNKKADIQIVVDCSTIDITIYKEFLENTLIVGQNLYFDLQFLYSKGIVCRNVYDTMIVEQVLYLGYPGPSLGGPAMSLAAIAERRLGVYLDKTVRGQIRWRGLDSSVIIYAANDVKYLEDIMWSQVNECKQKDCLKAAKVECDFVPVLAYCSWCGIKLDEKLWSAKMQQDEDRLNKVIKQLEDFVIKTNNPKFVYIDLQGDLFEGRDETPKCAFAWGKPGVKTKKQPVLEFIKSLGFNTLTVDKQTKQVKDSVDLKALKKQKGVNDEFLKLYIEYSEAYKVVSTYGITYLNAINPITGRIHTSFKQIAADTGRVACGYGEDDDNIRINPDLAKLKGFPLETKDSTKKCGYPNIQTLPADKLTRSSFICEEGNYFCSCDWSAIESRLGADIYQEKAMIDEFLHGSGDMHSLVAKMIFPELKDVPIKDIKKLYPELRSKAKPVELSSEDSL
jgi:DNA polymerase I-like protein with 3'-5' exonuclease and polymerase domains